MKLVGRTEREIVRVFKNDSALELLDSDYLSEEEFNNTDVTEGEVDAIDVVGKFVPKMLPILTTDKTEIILWGGGASAKTDSGLSAIVYWSAEYPESIAVVFRKKGVDLEKTVWNHTIEILKRYKIIDKVKLNKSQGNMKMTFWNGSIIYFSGLDDSERARGFANLSFIYMDEVSDFSQDDFDQLKGRMRASSPNSGPPHIVTSQNPVNANNWTKKHLVERESEHKLVIHSTYKDNPFVNEVTVRNIEEYKETNPDMYRIYGLGEWGTLSKLIFNKMVYDKQLGKEVGNWKPLEFDYKVELRKRLDLGHKLHLVRGMDTGFIDPTVIISSVLDLDTREVLVFKETYQTNTIQEDIEEMLMDETYSNETIYVDGQNKNLVEPLMSKFPQLVNATKGAGSIVAGLSFMQGLKFIVSTECPHLIYELENYSYKLDKKTGLYENQPATGQEDHCIDALRYSLLDFSKKQIKQSQKGTKPYDTAFVNNMLKIRK